MTQDFRQTAHDIVREYEPLRATRIMGAGHGVLIKKIADVLQDAYRAGAASAAAIVEQQAAVAEKTAADNSSCPITRNHFAAIAEDLRRAAATIRKAGL